ncbi:cytochrome b-c1 complex subunit 8-like [Petromyzon marinus]|uniref:Cytochrome b-c1 complex subunit 8 n=1 Tax=Petromyzon marinus TaxID=7757 RepID=A0AAJ7SIA8_PETMA|nr:cytochrome b-c1 complex subunit 8 [Petromyzon marinus]
MGGDHLEFGRLARVRHVVTFSLSPFEQRAFANFFTQALPNTLRRISAQALRVGPPFMLLYFIYDYGSKEFTRSRRKDSSLYSDDE